MSKIPTVKATKLLPAMFVLLLLGNIHPVSAQENTGLRRTVLLQKTLSLPSPNIDTKVMQVAFPPHFKAPWHTHEGPGPRYIVKGALNVIQHGKTATYSAGEVFWETGELMSVENTSDQPAELIMFEMAPAK